MSTVRMKKYNPHPALREYISYVTIYRPDFTAGALSNIYRFVPTHQRYMMFYLDDPIKILRESQGNTYDTRPTSVSVGPLDKSVTLDMGSKHLAIGVAFTPSGMFRLFNIPLPEMYDLDVDTTLILGNEIEELNNRLRDSMEDWDNMFLILQQYLLRKLDRLKPCLPIDMAIAELVDTGGNAAIDHIANLSCLSNRQFERKCLERLGMPPKQYARLVRFGRAYKLKEFHPELTWTAIAHRSGYYDQMHFIRDFKKFAGITPSFIHEEELMNTIRLHRLIE
ncbi:helix-turn-helix domain-containing protein [Chitinophaga pendula]|uniref:AraC family transcriptional regulator n=1 Tax=Chitinophaga TaxID=79328 RepID=UPI000BB06739|nr:MULTISPECIES: helix-turn-helix domain-containing protein [Chitinophaga]ASZ13833.1 hypothetical protein CK934_24195 [Chitinophaga sp. MD30]UCJ08544.1 helix-turn-helix domain-containing protein [Chitinophaga pendula]